MERLNDGELEDLAREVHRMWHAGASWSEAVQRLQVRLSRGRWDKIPWLLRPLLRSMITRAWRDIWGPQACGPGHEIVICDEPGQV